MWPCQIRAGHGDLLKHKYRYRAEWGRRDKTDGLHLTACTLVISITGKISQHLSQYAHYLWQCHSDCNVEIKTKVVQNVTSNCEIKPNAPFFYRPDPGPFLFPSTTQDTKKNTSSAGLFIILRLRMLINLNRLTLALFFLCSRFCNLQSIFSPNGSGGSL